MNPTCAQRPLPTETLLVVWQVHDVHREVSGVTDDPANALVSLVQTLRACPGEAWAMMRPARLAASGRPEYDYLPVLLTLHRDPATGSLRLR
ncbi:hypothetical protein [Spongiactinospora sp. TRM90649]|uniref:hypothetical protein n=1 Tax=Spongiactinospora sp. TRM90649 TaxID=3031114 RepID=UPI0023F79425|nr:hypothetical protein [Spongiactinospora sp. TRM90649]MDF5758184.1 hypothetical protein [Spongiactinospora sp. TRM90649]